MTEREMNALCRVIEQGGKAARMRSEELAASCRGERSPYRKNETYNVVRKYKILQNRLHRQQKIKKRREK